MKYYLAELKERNGEYEYYHIFRLQTDKEPAAALNNIARNWHRYEQEYLESYGKPLHTPECDAAGKYYFNGGEVCVMVSNWQEIAKEVFDGLPYFLTIFER